MSRRYLTDAYAARVVDVVRVLCAEGTPATIGQVAIDLGVQRHSAAWALLLCVRRGLLLSGGRGKGSGGYTLPDGPGVPGTPSDRLRRSEPHHGEPLPTCLGRDGVALADHAPAAGAAAPGVSRERSGEDGAGGPVDNGSIALAPSSDGPGSPGLLTTGASAGPVPARAGARAVEGGDVALSSAASASDLTAYPRVG